MTSHLTYICMHLRQMKDCANGTGVVMYRVNISNGYYRVLSVHGYIVDKGSVTFIPVKLIFTFDNTCKKQIGKNKNRPYANKIFLIKASDFHQTEYY